MSNIFHAYKLKVSDILGTMAANGDLPAGLDYSRVNVEPPKEAAHGDMATNAAMVLSKAAGKNPRQLGEALAERMKAMPGGKEVSVAGPGFVNFRLADSEWTSAIRNILLEGTQYGDSKIGLREKVNVEYVSANPTGPLTVGHARGAVVGDSLAKLLEKAGFDVTREYYINDAGAQVEKLARTVYLRYREALGENIGEIPTGYYPGEYLKDVGAAIAQRDGKKWLGQSEADWLPVCKAQALEMMMAEIKADLGDMGIRHNVFSSEQAVIDAGAVEKAFNILQDKGLIYTGVLEPPKGKAPDDWEERPQTLFKATQFGDDVDRPLKKSDGSWTYFANDIAYHWDKYSRGAKHLVDILGADHHGYIKRIRAAVRALTDEKADVNVLICQIVHTFDNGQPVRMSKRAGTFVTLRDMLDKVGKDVLRFVMLTRSADQTIEFDFAKVVEQSNENPVFYVQYGHARCCSILRNAREMFPKMDLSPGALTKADLGKIVTPEELRMIRLLAGWPRLVESAALAHEPHRIAFYLRDVVSEFHSFYDKIRILNESDPETSNARLALLTSIKTVIASGLAVMGVTPVEEMR
jgi:arginyl-tRNA synthetase